MGDVRRVTETTVRHRHLVTAADVISLLKLRAVAGSTIVSAAPVSLDHLAGEPGLLIVTQDPITETPAEDIPTR